MLKRVPDGNGGRRWLVKQKFALGWGALALVAVVALTAETVTMAGLGTTLVPLIVAIFAADVADKGINGGSYTDTGSG